VEPCFKRATDRFKCDVVLALAVEHHLALSQGLSFQEIIEQLALYSNKYLIIEFVDRNDAGVTVYLKQYATIRTAWYTKERFEATLAQTFNIVATAPSDVVTRTIYLCEKK
jgi:hypothetical protein